MNYLLKQIEVFSIVNALNITIYPTKEFDAKRRGKRNNQEN